MDDNRFDALARLLSNPSSRRSAVSLTAGGILGALATAAATAKKRKRKCKKKCGPCRKCRHGKCKPKPNGTPCGACQICTAGQCGNAPDNTPCDDGNPCTVSDVCTNGVCDGTPGNQGQICGTSTHGGTAIRCCNGACPDPNCVPSGDTDVSCAIVNDCLALACCAQQSASCNPGGCFCFFAQAGEPCGSDLDCSNGAGSATACICGTCQQPPP
jgi:hypothetical protein